MVLAEGGLVIQGLRARAGSFELGPIDLDVECDRVLAILGPSGAGKTMLLETIAGFRAAAAGAISLGGRQLGQLPPEERAIGFVFQDAALFPHLSVHDNVGFALRARGERHYGQRVDALLAHFEITPLGKRSPGSLSGGERQRVALARALAAATRATPSGRAALGARPTHAGRSARRPAGAARRTGDPGHPRHPRPRRGPQHRRPGRRGRSRASAPAGKLE